MEQAPGSQWWLSYQPVSYKLQNHLGDDADFRTMVAQCNKCGVKIIADAVTNHMASGSGSGSGGSSYGGRAYPGTYSAADFHHSPGDESTNCAVSDFTDRDNVQRCDLVGLPDIDSGAAWPRTRLGSYLGMLAGLGVAGVRVDAAKHQDANELGAILRANAKRANLEIYQEVIGNPGEAVEPSEYTGNGRVTEFAFGYGVSDAVRSAQLTSLKGLTTRLLPSDSAIAFIDNHDTQRASSVLASKEPNALLRRGFSPNASQDASNILTYKDGESYALAVAMLLAWPYGRARECPPTFSTTMMLDLLPLPSIAARATWHAARASHGSVSTVGRASLEWFSGVKSQEPRRFRTG